MADTSNTHRHITDQLLGSLARVQEVQATILGQFYDLHGVVFFVVATICTFLFTSAVRTAQARLPVFLVLALNFLVEKLLGYFAVAPAAVGELDPSIILLHGRLSLCRKVAVLIAGSIIGWVAYHHKDYGRMNHDMLNQVLRQNEKLIEQNRGLSRKLTRDSQRWSMQPNMPSRPRSPDSCTASECSGMTSASSLGRRSSRK